LQVKVSLSVIIILGLFFVIFIIFTVIIRIHVFELDLTLIIIFDLVIRKVELTGMCLSRFSAHEAALISYWNTANHGTAMVSGAATASIRPATTFLLRFVD